MTRVEALLGIIAGIYKDETEALADKNPPVTINNLEKLIVEISKKGDGSGSLPEVTDDDNGDVLTVVEGAWAKAAPSGGGATAIFHEYDEANSRYDVTPTQLLEEMQSGAQIYFVYNNMFEDELSSASYGLLTNVELSANYDGEGGTEIVGYNYTATIGSNTIYASADDDYFIFGD